MTADFNALDPDTQEAYKHNEPKAPQVVEKGEVMESKYKLRQWPRRIRIEQDAPGVHNANIIDADTNERLNAVLSLYMSRRDDFLLISMAAHEPFKAAANRDESDAAYEVEQGVLVEQRRYLVTALHIECEG